MVGSALQTDIEYQLQRRSWRSFSPVLEALYEKHQGDSRRAKLARGMRVTALVLLALIVLDIYDKTATPRVDILMRMSAFIILWGLNLALRRISRRWIESFAMAVGCCIQIATTELLGLMAQPHFGDRYVLCSVMGIVGLMVVLPVRPITGIITLVPCEILYILILGVVPSPLPLAENFDMPIFAFGGFCLSFYSILLREMRQRALYLQNLRFELAAADLQSVNAELLHHSNTDMLTGLANRRYFETVALRRCQEQRGPGLALILLDIDFFKKFNDSAGHQAGDQCLRQVAGAIAGSLRQSDELVARYGGEEFVVLLPAVTQEVAVQIGERVRASVEALGLPHPGLAGQHVTISVGVAWRGNSSEPVRLEALLQAADQALYQAKDGGRNRVVSADDVTGETQQARAISA